MDYFEAGKNAAHHIWSHWKKTSYVEPIDPLVREFAEGALLEFERLQEEAPGVMHVMAEGAHRGAQQLNLDDYHGVMEVLQNADDLLATEVVMGFREGEEFDELLIAHDGAPAVIQHILAMNYAFISTKGDDAKQKGKFGVGLKTLSRISSRMEVHSNTYSFATENQRITKIEPSPAIEGIYQPGGRSTLLCLRLYEDFDIETFFDWFKSLDASILLFLDTVRTFRLKVNPSEPVLEHILNFETEEGIFTSESSRGEIAISWSRYSDRSTGRAWTKYQAEIDVPKNLSRSHKKTGDKTRIALALPDESSQQKIYSGLPTYIQTKLPFSLDAQFDPDTSRESLLHNAWNKWLVNELVELVTAVALNRVGTNAAKAWELLPLLAEMTFADSYLGELTQKSFLSSREFFKQSACVLINGEAVPLSSICFETQQLEGLIDTQDYPLLCNGKIGLPESARDNKGRWRQVLAELDCCERISIADAFKIFERDDICSRKTPEWYVSLLSTALGNLVVNPIFTTQCLLLVSGKRISPQRSGNKTSVFVRHQQDESLAQYELVQLLHPVYFSNNDRFRPIEKFFLEQTNYTASAKSEDILTSFVNRYESSPTKLSDQAFLEIKALYDSIIPDYSRIGHRLGNSILLDSYYWNRGKKIRCEKPVSDCYLPAGLVKDKSGQWAAAADKTQGLVWISSRYKELFRGSRKAKKESKESKEPEDAVAKSYGPGKFLRALGAEIAPRIQVHPDRRTIAGSLLPLQSEALSEFSVTCTEIEDDFFSSDLEAVVANICAERKKVDRKSRGVALFEAIDYSWDRLYTKTLTCLPSYFYYSRKHPGRIPSTWVARLASQPWLSSQSGEFKAPKHLAICTSAARAVYGDAPKLFAYGLHEEYGQSNFPTVIGMETNPRAKGIVAQIRSMHDGNSEFDQTQLLQLYSALAEIARKLKSPVSASTPFDDMTVGRLQFEFSTTGAKGLLYINGQWISPKEVFCGKDIFHGRRLFVPVKKKLDPLWKVLGLRQPNFEDCLSVLRDVAKVPLAPTDESLLIDIYRQLNSFVSDLSTAQKKRLSEIPLWCHGQWVRTRPVYSVSDTHIAQNFSRQIAIWSPPATDGIKRFVEALRLIAIDSRQFKLCGVTSTAEMAGEELRPRFMQAVTALEEHFARTNEAAYKSIKVKWEDLRQSPIYISTHLAVEWSIPGKSVVNSGIAAYGTTEPRGLFFKSAEDIGEKDSGGRIIAECFFPEALPEDVKLAWFWAWQESMKVKRHEISLASEEEDESTDTVSEAAIKSTGKKSTYERGTSATKGKATKEGGEKTERRLKDFSEISTVSVNVVNPESDKGSYKEPTRRGLKRQVPAVSPVGKELSEPSKSSKAIITYSTQELEEMALRCLHHTLNHGNLGELDDFRNFRGIGADAAIQLKKFFEIKASACEMPDRVELTLNELDRARLSADSFYLVVVSGLEKGYETMLHFYKNPLRTLDWSPSSTVVVSGLKTRKADQVKLFAGGD